MKSLVSKTKPVLDQLLDSKQVYNIQEAVLYVYGVQITKSPFDTYAATVATYKCELPHGSINFWKEPKSILDAKNLDIIKDITDFHISSETKIQTLTERSTFDTYIDYYPYLFTAQLSIKDLNVKETYDLGRIYPAGVTQIQTAPSNERFVFSFTILGPVELKEQEIHNPHIIAAKLKEEKPFNRFEDLDI